MTDIPSQPPPETILSTELDRVNLKLKRAFILVACLVLALAVEMVFLYRATHQPPPVKFANPKARASEADNIVSNLQREVKAILARKMTSEDSAQVNQKQVQIIYWQGARDVYSILLDDSVRVTQ